MSGQATIVAVLRGRAAMRPSSPLFTFLEDGETEQRTLTFGELDRRANGIAARLATSGAPGDRVLLVLPAGLAFIEAFFGCLYGRRVAVPLAVPRRRLFEDYARIERIARDTGARVVVSTATIADQIRGRCPNLGASPAILWIDIEEIAEATAELAPGADPSPDELAYLQYTSGSTSDPRGVMVAHENLLAATRFSALAFDIHENDQLVSWLPHHHDMGLVGIILQSVHSGCRCRLMSPQAFMAKPDRWLKAITRYEATHSGGPNVAYDLCVRQAAHRAGEFRLSTWRCAFNGAERVRPATLEGFVRAFEPSGFRMENFRPCYGLAEATLQVSGGPIGAYPTVRTFTRAGVASDRSVSCGRSWSDAEVRIVDPALRTPLDDGQVGEIWIRGSQVTRGYFSDPASTAALFGATLDGEPDVGYLRSGDLGAIVEGELYVMGRLKDAIILNGLNHEPDAIEEVILRCDPRVRPGGVAAIGAEIDEQERLVCFVEVRDRSALDLARAVRSAVHSELDLTVHRVVLVLPGALPRTTSGKIRRGQLRQLYAEGAVPTLSED